MRNVKAKKLRALARMLTATVKPTAERNQYGAVTRWLTGYRRVYQALKRIPPTVRGL